MGLVVFWVVTHSIREEEKEEGEGEAQGAIYPNKQG